MLDVKSEVFGDVSVVEVVHLVHHADGGVDDGEGAEGTSALAETEAEMEQGFGTDDVEHPAVAALVATMREDHIVLSGRIESDGSEGAGSHDKAVD